VTSTTLTGEKKLFEKNAGRASTATRPTAGRRSPCGNRSGLGLDLGDRSPGLLGVMLVNTAGGGGFRIRISAEGEVSGLFAHQNPQIIPRNDRGAELEIAPAKSTSKRDRSQPGRAAAQTSAVQGEEKRAVNHNRQRRRGRNRRDMIPPVYNSATGTSGRFMASHQSPAPSRESSARSKPSDAPAVSNATSPDRSLRGFTND